MITVINLNKSIIKDTIMKIHTPHKDKEAEVYFNLNFKQGYMNVETAMLIDIAINNLLKRDNILRNENIPNEEQVINEQEHIINHQEDEEFYKDENTEEQEEGIQNDENLDEDDLEQRNE